MTEWRQVSWKRVGMMLLIIFLAPILLSIALFVIVDQVDPWHQVRTIAHDNPIVNSLPVELPDKTISGTGGSQVERFGLSMQLPWTGTVQAGKGFSIVDGKYGFEIVDPGSLSSDLALSVDRKVSMDSQKFPSKFAWATAVLQVTPNQMKWWQSSSSKRNTMTQVVIKLLFLEPFTNTDKLYSVHFGEMRGFQQGDPPYKVTLNLYDPEDRHYKIFIDQEKNTSPPVTQAEINALVASMHTAPR